MDRRREAVGLAVLGMWAVLGIVVIVQGLAKIDAQNPGCSPTTVCKLSEEATDKVFDCVQRGPVKVPWSGEDVDDRRSRACIRVHESTCAREPGFVCGDDQPLPCTLAFAQEETAACAP